MPIVAKLHQPNERRGRRRRLRSLAFLPTLITLGNLLCGFAAIHFALRAMLDLGAGVPDTASQTLNSAALERMLPSYLSVGAGLVILGMVFDCFDGLIARATHTTTDFGGQLDSLADIVNHGVAPATLMLAFMATQLHTDSILPSPISEHFLGRASWVAAAIYVAFQAIRLARYNVEHAQTDFDFRTFRGLPTPGAAGVVAALLIIQDQFGTTGKLAIAYALPGVALTLGLLMVSRIPYRRVHRAYLLGKKPLGQVITFIVVLAVFLSFKAPTLLVIVLWYAASGPVELIYRRIRGHRSIPETEAAPETIEPPQSHQRSA